MNICDYASIFFPKSWGLRQKIEWLRERGAA